MKKPSPQALLHRNLDHAGLIQRKRPGHIETGHFIVVLEMPRENRPIRQSHANALMLERVDAHPSGLHGLPMGVSQALSIDCRC